jgi:hypothetical protein
MENVVDVIRVVSLRNMKNMQMCLQRSGRRLPKELWQIIFNMLMKMGLPTLDETLKRAWDAYLCNESWGPSVRVICIDKRRDSYSRIVGVAPPKADSVYVDCKGNLRARFANTVMGPTALNKLRGPPSRKTVTPGPVFKGFIPDEKKRMAFARVCDKLVEYYMDGTLLSDQEGNERQVSEISSFVMNTCVEYRRLRLKEVKAIKQRIESMS